VQISLGTRLIFVPGEDLVGTLFDTPGEGEANGEDGDDEEEYPLHPVDPVADGLRKRAGRGGNDGGGPGVGTEIGTDIQQPPKLPPHIPPHDYPAGQQPVVGVPGAGPAAQHGVDPITGLIALGAASTVLIVRVIQLWKERRSNGG
jgi:hypothetical protein